MMLASLAGLATGCYVVFGLWPEWKAPVAGLVLILCLALPCAAIEFWLNLHRADSGFDFGRANFSLHRVVRKLTAMWAIMAILLLCYAIFPLYRAELYAPFHWTIRQLLIPFLALSIPYVAIVDAYQSEPEDSLYSWGNRLLSPAPPPSTKEINYLLGWVVKGFFLPLMFSYLCGQIGDVKGQALVAPAGAPFIDVVGHGYSFVYTAAFFVDVLVATAGYVMTLRLLGTEIRSVEPTVAGWVVAVGCYDPFWPGLYNSFFSYTNDRTWGSWLSGTPALYTLWALAILFLLVIYSWTTVSFGIRFSNLTYRGIITSGPYRWTKHPAYVSKNLSWWLISIPFLPANGSPWTALQLCLGLAGINLIYFLRAKTEERHLAQDPVYQEYTEFIRQHGIFRHLSWRPRGVQKSLGQETAGER